MFFVFAKLKTHLVVIFVHARVIPLQDKLLLEIHGPVILNVLGKSLLRAEKKERLGLLGQSEWFLTL